MGYGDYMQRLFNEDAKRFHATLFPRQKRASDAVTLDDWHAHFTEFFKASSLDSDNPEPHVDIRSELLGSDDLVTPFTAVEVRDALRNLKLGTCAGADSWTPSFFKGEGLQEAWIPLLMAIFNRCLHERRVPRDWLFGVVRPIYKNRGERTDPIRYRPIMLCTVWYKLFVYTLMERVAPVLDPVRHETQAGFRKGCETVTWILLVWGLIFWAKKTGNLLFLLSMDLAKAYDSVHHDRLWMHLERMGVHPWIIDLVRYMYQHSRAVVRGSRGCSRSFGMRRGVRQGCPLSPLLYTCYHDNFPRLLEERDVQRVVFGLVKIIATIFADDTLVPLRDEDGIGEVSDLTIQFERDWHIKTNHEKTEALAINPGSRTSVEFGGHEVPLQRTLKYLGVFFYDGPGDVNVFREHISKVMCAGNVAVGRLRARAFELGLTDPRTLVSLFKMYVLGKVQYAAPVWVFFLTQQHRRDLNDLLVRYLKAVLRLPTRTLKNFVYLECGVLPVTFYLYRNALKFWNRMMALPDAHPTRAMLFWLRGQPDSQRSWWVKFRDLVRRFLPGFDGFVPVNVSEWGRAYKAHIVEQLRSGHPRIVAFYNRIKPGFAYTNALSSFDNIGLRTVWVRFRARLHGLEIDAADLRDRNVPLHERYCPFCLANGVSSAENEVHFLFECPLYARLRVGSVVQESGGSLFRLFNCPGQVRVALYIRRALALRAEWLDTHS